MFNLNRRYRLIYCLICLSFFIALTIKPSAILAAPELIISKEAQYDFAIELFKQQNYSFSIKELQRFIYFFADDERVPLALSYIGQAYFYSGEYEKAIKQFENLFETFEDTPEAYNAFFFISDCYVKLENPGQAILTLTNLTRLTQDQALLDRAYYKMGWIALESGVRSEAIKLLEEVSPEFQEKNKVDQLIHELSANQPIPHKNPTLSGVLSIIPGAGQLYCGRYEDALSAFVINTGLILAAVESFDNELYALGATITFFEMGFYAGNIHGAITSAHKYNESQLRGYSQKLRKKYRMGLLPAKQNSSIMFSLQYLY